MKNKALPNTDPKDHTLEELQRLHGEIKTIELPPPSQEGPTKKCYLRRPDRVTIKYALSKQYRADQSIDTISAGEILLNKCWVGGDETIKTDDTYYFRACLQATLYLNETMGFTTPS